MEAILRGLDAPDDGTLRKAALLAFAQKVAEALAVTDTMQGREKGSCRRVRITAPRDLPDDV